MAAFATKSQRVFFIKDVEQTIGKPRVTLRRWWRNGKFPEPKMINGRLAWAVDTINRWLSSQLGDSNHG